MLQRISIFSILILLSTLGFSQIEEFDDEVLKNELTAGINTNTNGSLISGFNFRYTYLTKPKNFNLFEIEIVNVKNEREERFASAVNTSFIGGKLSYLLALRPSFGKELTLFEKYPEDGIRLNLTYSGGPTFGFVTPYMIKYYRGPSDDSSIEAYDPRIHNIGLITGDAGILKGFNQSKLNLGAHLRSSLNFEYGAFEDQKIGLETGFTVEAYTKKNVLTVNYQERYIYSAFFIHLYYGISF